MTTATSITVRVPLAIRHRPGRKTVVTPIGDGLAPVTTRADPTLVKALARGFRYQRMLDEGRYTSVTDMAAAEKIDRGYLGRLLQLTLLAPDIVEAILYGRHCEGVTLAALWEGVPLEWREKGPLLNRERGEPNCHGAVCSAPGGCVRHTRPRPGPRQRRAYDLSRDS